jgi:hypothetical protein
VFARYTTPQDSVPRWEVLEWGGVVTVGDVPVRSGTSPLDAFERYGKF